MHWRTLCQGKSSLLQDCKIEDNSNDFRKKNAIPAGKA